MSYDHLVPVAAKILIKRIGISSAEALSSNCGMPGIFWWYLVWLLCSYSVNVMTAFSNAVNGSRNFFHS